MSLAYDMHKDGQNEKSSTKKSKLTAEASGAPTKKKGKTQMKLK
jgi:hypothetical protein